MIAASVRADEPKQAKRLFADTPLRLLGRNGPYTLFEITYRRTPAPDELRTLARHARRPCLGRIAEPDTRGLRMESRACFLWKRTGSPLANFCGAYVENAFGESQETVVDLRTGGGDPAALPTVAIADAPPKALAPSRIKGTDEAWWLRTEFELPFMYTIGAEPRLRRTHRSGLPHAEPFTRARTAGLV